MEMVLTSQHRFFYVGMAALAILIVFAGFVPTYYLKAQFGTPQLNLLVHVHGLVCTSWFLLFFAQTMLVAMNRSDLHRRLGVVAAGVALALVVVGSLTAIAAAKRGHSPIPALSPLVFLAVPLGDMLIFAVLVGLAVVMRRRTDVHKRLMLLATVSILGPPIARLHVDLITNHLPFSFIACIALLIVFCAAYDYRATGHLHRVYSWGGGLVVASYPLRMAFAGSPMWNATAAWLTA